MTTWTAPESGWYEIAPGKEPRKLTEGERAEVNATADPRDVIAFDTDEMGTHVWSWSAGNIALPSGQVISPMCWVVVEG